MEPVDKYKHLNRGLLKQISVVVNLLSKVMFLLVIVIAASYNVAV